MALAAAYIDSRVRSAAPTEHLWHHTLQELNALARNRYRQSQRYAQYARHAEQEGLHNQATLLRAMSQADAVQCQNCIKAINSLGGVYNQPTNVDAEMQDTRRHLQQALDNKTTLHENHSSLILHTLNEGNRYIARMLTWCDASDIEQILILRTELCRTSLQDSIRSHYRVCPVCGNLSDKALTSCHCPHCMTSEQELIIFE